MRKKKKKNIFLKSATGLASKSWERNVGSAMQNVKSTAVTFGSLH
jgi:hypothetical protein